MDIIKSFSDERKIPFISTSSKNFEGINETFELILQNNPELQKKQEEVEVKIKKLKESAQKKNNSIFI